VHFATDMSEVLAFALEGVGEAQDPALSPLPIPIPIPTTEKTGGGAGAGSGS